MSSGIRALGILLVAGFAGGFFLSNGSARYFSLTPAAVAEVPPADGAQHSSARAGQQGGPQGGSEQQEGGGGGSPGQSSQRGSTDSAGESSQQNSTADGAGGSNKQGQPSQDASLAQPGPSDGPLVLTGDRALQFLASNTLQFTTGDKTILRYMSGQGWQGDKDGHSVIVHSWVWKSDQLCEVTARATLDCQAISVKTERKPGKALGSLLGTLFLPDQKTRLVLRGNVAGVPEHIPLIDGLGSAPHDRQPRTPSATGQTALDALLGHSLVTEASPHDVHGFYYQQDGAWLDATPLAHDVAKGVRGVIVRIGRWDYRGETLCQEAPGLELSRECFKPEQWGTSTFHLVPESAGPIRTLTLLAGAHTR